MTILFFSRLFYPHIGGVEKHVLEVSRILIKKGHKVVVVTEELSNVEGDSSLALGMTGAVEIYRIPVGRNEWFKKFKIWFWLWRHQELINKADVVHCHDVFFWYLPFRFLFSKKPVYTTFHGYEGNSLPSRKAIFMHWLAEKLSKGNICVGDYLKKWYGTKTDMVSYGGVNVSKSQISNLKSQKHISNLKIVFIGRLEEETGITEYLRAVRILKERGYKIQLDVLGDGRLRKEAEDFCRNNKLAVRFYGFINNTQESLSKSDFVFTSRYLGILESFANKKLVFSVYNNDVKRDYLQMSPFSNFIIIAESGKEICLKLIYYFKNSNEEKKMVEKAYNYIKDQTWDKVASLYISLWRTSE